MFVSFHVYSFYTKYAEGFLQHEIDNLLKLFPGINEEEFLNALLDNTCLIIDKHIVMRKNDIEASLFTCLKQIK